MFLPAGTRLGTYEIVSPLGAGGMGEVYRARDTKLGRSVAIKVLPEEVATHPDRIARLEREAKVLASLNHPHIAALFGMEESAGRHFLVMELVEGETLAARIASPHASGRGLRVEDAVKIALQIAGALEVAHECGIIHRDLKPANINITPDEAVKVLDFGLAKATAGDRSGHDLSRSPTVTFGGTREGTILGTAAYMSPEQARGKPLDKRTDIWAFGCVFYEMLTGRLAFPGETVSDTVAAILGREPDWLALPAETPERVRRLLRRCLEKDTKRRVHDIADARIELEDALSDPSAPIVTHGAHATTRVRMAWIAASLSVAAIVAALALGRVGFFDRSAMGARVYRSSIVLPEGTEIPADRSSWNLGPAGRFALSPDGRRVAFVARRATEAPMLWVRPLDALVAQSLAGTEGATYPFWSPDSRFVAFLAQGKLKKIDVTGGAPLTLCEASLGATGAWNRDDVILFTPKGASEIYRVSASGGTPSPVTSFDAASGDTQHWFPFFLPDGRHFLYSTLGSKRAGATDPSGVHIGSLDPQEASTLLLEDGSHAKYAEGHLIFLRGSTLMARPFDASRRELRGEAEPLAEQLQTTGGAVTGAAGAFSVSDTGVLAYQTGSGEVRSQLVWFDRGGKQTGLLGDQADYGDVELSPDDQRVAVSILDPAHGTRDLWLYHVKRELRTRFTFDSTNEFEPIWSPNGDRLVFARIKEGVGLFQKRSSGSGSEDALLEGGLGKFPSDWSADGRFILYVAGGAAISRSDLLVLPLFGEKKPFPFLETSFIETRGQFSPDGRWIAYASSESGQLEIYVAGFPNAGEKRRVSTAGGMWPRWRRDGREIVYLADNMLMAATVNGEAASFEAGAARPLFAVRPRPLVSFGNYPYDISADGQRFLVNTLIGETASTTITLVINWTAGLKK